MGWQHGRSHGGRGCTGQRMGRQHGHDHGLGMDTLANGWVGSMGVIIVWAWMHWPMNDCYQ